MQKEHDIHVLSPYLQFKCNCDLCKETIWLYCVSRLWWNRGHHQKRIAIKLVDAIPKVTNAYINVVRHRILYYLVFLGTHQKETPGVQQLELQQTLDRLCQEKHRLAGQLTTVQRFNGRLLDMKAKAKDPLVSDQASCHLLWLPLADTGALDKQMDLIKKATDTVYKRQKEAHLRRYPCFYEHHDHHIKVKVGFRGYLRLVNPAQEQVCGLYACHLTTDYVWSPEMSSHSRALMTLTLKNHEQQLELQYENMAWSPHYRDRFPASGLKKSCGDIDAENLRYWEQRLAWPENVSEVCRLLNTQSVPVFSFDHTASWWSLPISTTDVQQQQHIRCYNVHRPTHGQAPFGFGFGLTGKSPLLTPSNNPAQFYTVWSAGDIGWVSARARDQMFRTTQGLYGWLLKQRRGGSPLINPRRMCHACLKICWEDKLERCARCFSVAYCNKQCQRNDWVYHKEACKKI